MNWNQRKKNMFMTDIWKSKPSIEASSEAGLDLTAIYLPPLKRNAEQTDVSIFVKSAQQTLYLKNLRFLTANKLTNPKAISADDGKILYKTLPCLVRMCRKENRRSEKALGAETLAYLIEVDTELQRVASISDHLIQNLSLFLTKSRENSSVQKLGDESLDVDAPSVKEVQNLKQAALRVNFEIQFINIKNRN